MNATELVIEPITSNAVNIDALASLLVDTVAGGASVSFMHPLSMERARAFWTDALTSAGRGERVVLGGFAEGCLAGTVSLFTDMPENQPHRAEIGKLMTHAAFRHKGVATALMRAAEACARAAGRSLIVLDTSQEGGAAVLYEKLGYQRAGIIPDFAHLPHGGLCGTLIFWKRLD